MAQSVASSRARLLLIACSERKRLDPGGLPAIERYDGPAFRVLRRYLRERKDTALEIYVLSAEFGLIRSDRVIPDYERRMNGARAAELQECVSGKLRTVVNSRPWREIGICVGRDYLAALNGSLLGNVPNVTASILGGGLGRRLTVLKQWLEGCDCACGGQDVNG